MHLLRNKTEVVAIMTDFISLISTQFNSKIKFIRSDNAQELCEGDMKILLKKHVIFHQTSCSDTP